MAVRRSTQLVIIGISVFVIGAGLVFVGLKTDAKHPAPAARAAAPAQASPGSVVAQGGAVTPVPVAVPKGFVGVAVQLDHVAGLGGYAKPGDTIDVFATVKGGTKTHGLTPPYAKLVLSNVNVLTVSGADPSAGAGNPMYLLALRPEDAERVIFFAKFESLWAALVPSGTARTDTHGRDYDTAL
jgi:hypothetical protein